MTGKRLFIIAILAVVTSNINLYIRSAYPVNHGRGSDMPAEVCPIKGLSHGQGGHHGHDAHHSPSLNPSPASGSEAPGKGGGVILKCDCSYDYSTSSVYEPAVTKSILGLNPPSFVLSTIHTKTLTYTSREPIPPEGPPKILS